MAVKARVRVTLGVGDRLKVEDPATERLTVVDGVGGEAVGVRVVENDGDEEGEAEGLRLWEGVGIAVPLGLRDREWVGAAELVPLWVSECVGVEDTLEV